MTKHAVGDVERKAPPPPAINEVSITVYNDPPNRDGKYMFELQWWGYNPNAGKETLRAQFYRANPDEWIKRFRDAGRVVRVYGWPR